MGPALLIVLLALSGLAGPSGPASEAVLVAGALGAVQDPPDQGGLLPDASETQPADSAPDSSPTFGTATIPVVRAIEIATDLDEERIQRIPGLLALEVGKPMSEEAVRRTLTNLQASGLAREVEVRSRPAAGPEGGVTAVVVLWATVQVVEVKLEGELEVARRTVAEVVERGVGLPLSESLILQGVYNLTDFYERRGYLEAVARVRVDYRDPAEQQAVVVYQVTPGPRARVGEITFEGDPGPIAPQDLREALKLETGSVYRPRGAREASERLQSWLIEQGYRTARVEEPEETYDSETHRMAVTFPLEVGPRVEVTIVGAKQKELEKEGLLPFLGPEGFDEALLIEAEDRVERHYQEDGHYRVEVATRVEEEPGLLRVFLEVEPGPIYTLEEVTIEGNERVDDETVRSLIATTPRRLLALGSGRLVDDVLAADLENLRAYYALQGFYEAEVKAPVIEEEGRTLTVTIPVEEGRRRRVATVIFEGVGAFDLRQLEQDLASRELVRAGGPYHPVLLDDTVRYLLARYEAEGYLQARISSEIEWNEPRDRAAVRFSVLEGGKVVLDRVIIRGNRKTDSDVIRRALGLEAGEPASGAVLLEAQRRLYRLGAFSRAEVRLAPAAPGAPTRDVLVHIEEGKSRRFVYGVGYDTENGFRGLLGYSDSNVAGRGLTFGSDLRLSQRDSRARLSLDQPYLGRYEVPLTYTLFWVDEERPTFDAERWGGRVEAVRELSEEIRASLILDYRIVEASNAFIPDSADPDRTRQDSSVRISSFIPNVLLDHRDDPIDPTRGWSTYGQLQYAFPFLSTTEEFLKLFVQQTYYLPLGRFGVLAGSARAGAIEPFTTGGADPVLPPGLPSSRVSISERFFAGGANSHRAYERDELGLPGESAFLNDSGSRYFAVGGNGLLVLNLDYRFPVAGGVGGVVFVDAGAVWGDWQSIDPRDLKVGIGLGVRYRSPVGPLRLEVGYKLDPERGEDRPRIFLSVGNPF